MVSNENFWNLHTLNDFQQLLIYQNVHSYEITSVCFLKDGSIASSSMDKYVLIYNKNTFKIDIKIKENKRVCYMNVTKDGILITCMDGTYLNLYEIKNKNYKNIQTIRPYSLFHDIIGMFDDSHSIQKFIELKNGNLAILVWGYAICFYKKKKNSKKYSYLNKFDTKINESSTDLVELDDNQYCVSFCYRNLIKFLNMNLKNITSKIEFELNYIHITSSKNQLILINNNDLLLAGDKNLYIIDIQKKEIIKNIKFKTIGFLSFIYRLSKNNFLFGGWGNHIEQIEYDDIKKDIKIISNNQKNDYSSFSNHSTIYQISSISVFNNNLIVSPFNNELGYSSLIIYKYKN